jgi:hypothetical protein
MGREMIIFVFFKEKPPVCTSVSPEYFMGNVEI